MKYTVETTIALPRAKVIELFDSTENLPKWQEGFISMEHLSGDPGMPGAKSGLKYQMGKRQIEMIETITVRNLPDEFSGTYEADGVYNVVKNFFIEIDENHTKYVSENEFRFTNLMMKIMGFLMPGAFKKQSQKYLDDFKAFAESAS